jgi:electron transport complex protein RnfD
MSELRKNLEIGSSPHVTSGDSVEVIMRNVAFALVPVCVFAVYSFGIAAALVLATASMASTIGDWSAAVTGLLYGLTLPPDLPLWMVAVGGIFAIAIGKFLFGGLGSNAFNPALVGRAFLQAAFPQAMTHWAVPMGDSRFVDLPNSTLAFPFAQPAYDAVTAATPLAAMKFDSIQAENPELLFGLTSGSVGETGAQHDELAHTRIDIPDRRVHYLGIHAIRSRHLPAARLHAVFRRPDARCHVHGH